MSPLNVQPPTEVRTAVLLTHGKPAETRAAVHSAAELAERLGIELVASNEELGKHESQPDSLTGVSVLPERPDICLAFGGDGTILRCLRLYAGRSVPVFGVNYGTIGFLAAVEADELELGLERALAGQFETLLLPALETTIGGEQRLAFNDVSFTRRPHARVAELSYHLGGREVGHVRCDGLVAATPAGSTGYNLANGGPILAWGVEGYVVSFIAPHTLTARALVAAPDDELHVQNLGERDSVEVGLDGELAGELEPGQAIDISFRGERAPLAQLEAHSFYHRIRQKFGRLVGLPPAGSTGSVPSAR